MYYIVINLIIVIKYIVINYNYVISIGRLINI